MKHSDIIAARHTYCGFVYENKYCSVTKQTVYVMKNLFILLFSLCTRVLCAHDTAALTDHLQIKPLSDFRVMGVFELRTEHDVTSVVTYRTLNHEGGLKLRVVKVVAQREYNGEHGLWLYVMLTAPVWVDNGERLEAWRKFLIFLPDSAAIYDFEE